MYKIIFEDNTEFEGGNLENSLWNEIPNKPIKELKYYLENKTLRLIEYDFYNHEIEKIVLMNDKKIICNSIILSAKKGNNVLRIIIDIKTQLVGTKWVKSNKLNISGWKLGLGGVGNYFVIDKSRD